jgi:16S rRNA (cytosine967-C5)-methyltransferase
VYAVCSVLREEAEDVIAAAAEIGLEPAPFDAPIAVQIAAQNATASASSFRLMPHEHGTDGYFVASFVKPR